MRTIKELKQAVEAGRFDAAFTALYGCAGIPPAACRPVYRPGGRLCRRLWRGGSGPTPFSRPPAAGWGGNHTDHQRAGCLRPA